MKRVIIAVLALVGFSAAGFAQSAPAVKKTEPHKTQVVKNTADKKTDAKAVILNKDSKSAPGVAKTTVEKKEHNPVAVTKPAAVSKPVAVTKTNAAPLKKDGTPDKRYAANKHLKADGTKDLRYKENKPHH